MPCSEENFPTISKQISQNIATGKNKRHASKAINQRRTGNPMAKRIKTKGPTMIYKTLHRKHTRTPLKHGVNADAPSCSTVASRSVILGTNSLKMLFYLIVKSTYIYIYI